MSTKRYMRALRCEGPDVIPHQLWLIHPEFLKDATGIDYYERPIDIEKERKEKRRWRN